MKNKNLISFKAVSKSLTGSETRIRATAIPKKYEAAVQELDDLIEYWKKRNNIK